MKIKTREQIDKEITIALKSMGFKAINEDGKVVAKQEQESTYMSLFLETPEGKEWLNENNIKMVVQGDCPDYLFESLNGEKIGFEITELIIKNSRYIVRATLDTILKKVCQHFNKKEGLNYHIVLDVWDESDLRLPYKPFHQRQLNKLQASSNDIKNAIIKVMGEKPSVCNPVIRTSAVVASHIFNISYSIESYMSSCVNGWNDVFTNPYLEICMTIDKKSKKRNNYNSVCGDCALLIVSNGLENRNYVEFTDGFLEKSNFKSVFKDVYMLDIKDSKSVKATKLTPKKIGDINVK